MVEVVLSEGQELLKFHLERLGGALHCLNNWPHCRIIRIH